MSANGCLLLTDPLRNVAFPYAMKFIPVSNKSIFAYIPNVYVISQMHNNLNYLYIEYI